MTRSSLTGWLNQQTDERTDRRTDVRSYKWKNATKLCTRNNAGEVNDKP